MENPISLAPDASHSSGKAIAEGEVAVLRWLLEHAAVGKVAVFPDGAMAGVLLWGAGGELRWLELHDTFTTGTARRFPEVADLRTWEQHGQSLVEAN